MFSLKLDEPLRHWRKGRKTDSIVAISLIMFAFFYKEANSSSSIHFNPYCLKLISVPVLNKYDTTTIVVLIWDNTHQRAVNDFKGYENQN
jgi:hypothetical protein